MMQNDQELHHDDVLERAIDAVLRDPAPADPPPEQLAQLAARVRQAAEQDYPITLIERLTKMKTKTRIAVAAVALIAAFGLMSVFMPGGSSAVAFAGVAEALTNARSAKWKSTTTAKVKLPGETEERSVTMDAQCMFLAPSHERMETNVDGKPSSIQIVDGEKNKAITLVPATKTATVINSKNFPPEANPFGKTFLGLRELVASAQSGKAGKVERLGAKAIDGRSAEGFRIERLSMTIEIWADPETLLPVRVEYTTSDLKSTTVMTGFQINIPLEESLFAVDIPPDYTVQSTTEVDVSKTWTLLVGALKMAAECNDGVFPPELAGEQGVVSAIQRCAPTLAEKHKDSPTEALKAAMEITMNLSAFTAFVNAAPPDALHYAGKDVKLGTPNRPILWLEKKNAEQSVVFYADLSVNEVSSDEIRKFFEGEGGAKAQDAKRQ